MGYKILLADDDRDLLEMLGRYFERLSDIAGG